MNVGVIVFPGSNCDHDCYYAVRDDIQEKAQLIWHEDSNLPSGLDLVVLPGGFSYGDYLRCGAIAKFSKIIPEIISFAKNGGHVLGICNGFQILTEIGLLPGALLLNTSRKYICKDVFLSVNNNKTLFTNTFTKKQVITVPIAHGEGRYHINSEGLNKIKANEQIAFKYTNKNGQATEQDNPNGSIENIAGIFNKNKNVLGMMPHPERRSRWDQDCKEILKLK